jgi:hypothetical protein
MAKPLSEKTRIIRHAITQHKNLGNTALAEKLNEEHPGHAIKPADVANQRQAQKQKAGTNKKGKGNKKKAGLAASEPVVTHAEPVKTTAKVKPNHKVLSSGDLVRQAIAMVKSAGGIDQAVGILEALRELG